MDLYDSAAMYDYLEVRSKIENLAQAGREESEVFLDIVGDDDEKLIIDVGASYAGSVPIARKHLKAVLSSVGSQIQILHVAKQRKNARPGARLCQAIQAGLKNLRVLEIGEDFEYWTSKELKCLLKHMPSGLEKLKVSNLNDGEYFLSFPVSFQLIPSLFPQLKELSFHECYFPYWEEKEDPEDWDAYEARMLVKTLENLQRWVALVGQLPSLEALAFKNCTLQEKGWNYVVSTIQTHPNLKTVRFNDIGTGDSKFKFDKEVEDSILCHLAINKVSAKLGATDSDGDGPTLEKWVDAVVGSRNDIGCLDYLLSSFDPTIFAPAAIKGLTGPAYRRKITQSLATEKGAKKRYLELKQERQLGKRKRAEKRAEAFCYRAGEEEEDDDSDDDEESSD